MKRSIFGVMGAVLVCAVIAGAAEPVQPPARKDLYDPPYKTPTEIPIESPLRKQLFDQLRERLPKGARFTGNLTSFRNWAFFQGSAAGPNGENLKMGYDNNTDTVALWLHTGSSGWRLIDWSGGHSDAFYLEIYPLKYRTPIPVRLEKGGLPDWIAWDDLYKPSYKKPTEFPADSPLRKELFDLLREKMPAGTRFSGNLKAYRNWAVFFGTTVDAKDQPLAAKAGESAAAAALWLRGAKGWLLVDLARGKATAVTPLWPAKYNAPEDLFGGE